MKFIDVCFSPRQVSNPGGASPSSRKPELVVADWCLHNLPIRVVNQAPAGCEQLSLAHARHYVDGVLDGVLPNGFHGHQKDVSESLPWTSGSFLSAARCALSNGQVACFPTSE